MQKTKIEVDYESANGRFHFVFYEQPSLPLKKAGALRSDPNEWHLRFWAVDSDNRCWSGKENCMELIDALDLFRRSYVEDVQEMVWAMGKQIHMVDWLEVALDNGWKEPEFFYENCTYSIWDEKSYNLILKKYSKACRA